MFYNTKNTLWQSSTLWREKRTDPLLPLLGFFTYKQKHNIHMWSTSWRPSRCMPAYQRGLEDGSHHTLGSSKNQPHQIILIPDLTALKSNSLLTFLFPLLFTPNTQTNGEQMSCELKFGFRTDARSRGRSECEGGTLTKGGPKWGSQVVELHDCTCRRSRKFPL